MTVQLNTRDAWSAQRQVVINPSTYFSGTPTWLPPIPIDTTIPWLRRVVPQVH